MDLFCFVASIINSLSAAVDGTSNFLLAVLNFVNRGHKRDIKEEQASGFRGPAPFCLSSLIGGVLVALGMSSGALPQLHVQKAQTCAAFVVHTSQLLLCDSQQRCCLFCSWYLHSSSQVVALGAPGGFADAPQHL